MSKNNNSGYYKINEKRRIKINTLDKAGDKKLNTFINKADVQGFELEVLKVQKITKNKLPAIRSFKMI